MSADAPILYDWSTGAPIAAGYAPVTNRPGSALYAPQGGIVQLGSDYSATPKAQIPHIDSLGNAYVVPANPAGGASQVYTGQAPGALTTQYGTLGMMRQDTPSPAQFSPFASDMNGNLYVHNRSKQTFRAIMRGVPAAQNKYLAVLVNGTSGSMVLRLTVVMVYVTPAGVSGALLGQGSTTYYPMICELYRVSTANISGGTTISPTSCDTADTLATGTTVMQAPTISSYTASLYRADVVALVSSGESFYQRDDENNKSIVIRPGEGIALICLSSGTIGTAAGGTATATPDIQFVWTQAPA